MQLKLMEIDPDGVVHLAAEGEMSANDVQSANPLERVVGGRWSSNRVLLDMSRVSHIDSMAIGWLINCHKQFKESGGMMVLHSIPPGVAQVFEVLRIGSLFPLVEDREAAKAVTAGERS